MPNPTPRAEDAPDLRAAAQQALNRMARGIDGGPGGSGYPICRLCGRVWMDNQSEPDDGHGDRCPVPTVRTALARAAAPVVQPGDVREAFDAIGTAIDYLETANGIISEEVGDDDEADTRRTIRRARKAVETVRTALAALPATFQLIEEVRASLRARKATPVDVGRAVAVEEARLEERERCLAIVRDLEREWANNYGTVERRIASGWRLHAAEEP